MTVAHNVSFGLEMRRISAVERDRRVSSALDMVRMTEFKDRYPRQLSGGQQQRVAIARALVIEPKVFLLDEPLSNLDAKLRLEVREEIRALQQRLGLTTIFVTHDQEEALAISDRMAIMHEGKVQQVGTPQDLYERPANLFVADFLGKMNFFSGYQSGEDRFTTQGGLVLKVARSVADIVTVGVRPERVVLSSQPAFDNSVPVTLVSCSFIGSHIDVVLSGAGQQRLSCQIPNTAAAGSLQFLEVGARLFMNFKATDCVMFSERGSR
jgi:putative spermidine/putrescine transport system ATP-binding protein